MDRSAKQAADGNTRSFAAATSSTRRRQPDDTVDSLFQQGKELYEQKKYYEAENVFKSALQINQTDMRTLLYYAAMLRELGDSEKADQLLGQTMGDWAEYTSIGMKEPASPTELYRRPKVVSPKKDMAKLEFVRKSKRSNVHFYAVRTLKKQIENMELSQSGANGEKEIDEEEEDEEASYDDSSLLQASLDSSEPSFLEGTKSSLLQDPS